MESMTRCIVAIDPGANGGVAVCHLGRIYCYKLCPKIFISNMATLAAGYYIERMRIYLEDVGYHMLGNNAQSSATFARHVGWLCGVLDAHKLYYKFIKPKEWESYIGRDGESKAEKKKSVQRKMEARYPELKVTLAVSDALGILTYAMEALEDK